MLNVQRQIETLVFIKSLKLNLHLYMINGESLELWACKISDQKKNLDKEFQKRVNDRLVKKKNTKNLAMQFLADIARVS